VCYCFSVDWLRVCRKDELSFDHDVNISRGSNGAKMNRARSADDILDDGCHDDIDVTSPPPKPPLDLSSVIPAKLLTVHRFVVLDAGPDLSTKGRSLVEVECLT